MKSIEKYRKKDGTEPFSEWLKLLPEEVQWRIFAYIRRVAQGGAKKSLKTIQGCNGVKEICIPFGPGYRIYFAQTENRIVLLLVGGLKRTQKKDIEKAKVYWRNYNEKT